MDPAFRNRLSAGLLGAGILVLACHKGPLVGERPEPLAAPPNFLWIVADDLGYSDLGSYGGEIPTPHLDALAASGLRATDFYVAPRGAPTTAMLLTGVDNHVAGFGGSAARAAPDPRRGPGSEGRLRSDVATVASRLRDVGYQTLMAGKWELGDNAETRPSARGFARSFALHEPAASYWADMQSAVPGRGRAHYTRDGKDVRELPADYYSTRFFTDFAIQAIDEARAAGRPFFAYLAYQAPHGPLGLPDDWRDRYAGAYDRGYDAIREARLLRMKRLELVKRDVRPYPGIPTVPSWGDLSASQRRSQSRKMELYAAAVANLDFHLGRLFEHLRRIEAYDDTLIVFLSDNGAESGDRGPSGMDGRDGPWYAEHFPETAPEAWGRPGSFVEYGPAWAQVSMVPFRLFKGTQAEGGIRSPLLVSGPGVKGGGRIARALLHVADLTPTLLDYAGAPPPEAAARLRGRSLAPLLAGAPGSRDGPHDWLGFGFAGGRAVRRGPWKLVSMPPPFGIGKWRLYRLDRDPAELYDRASRRPRVAAELEALWGAYAEAHGLLPPVSGHVARP